MTVSRRLEALRAVGIDFVGGVPCPGLGRFLSACGKLPQSALLLAQRADQAVAACAGAWLAGGRPLAVLDAGEAARCLEALESLGFLRHVPLPVLIAHGTEGEGGWGEEGRRLSRVPALLELFGVPWREAQAGLEEEEAEWLAGVTAAGGAAAALLVGAGGDT